VTTAPTGPRRPVGVDRPCRACGRPIYFNYKGPIDGLCGRCTDRAMSRARPVAGRPRRSLLPARDRRARAALLLVVFLAGVAAWILLRPHLALL